MSVASIRNILSTLRCTTLTKMSSKHVCTNASLIAKEKNFGAHNYEPLPVVIERGKGSLVWDVEGKAYLDFLAGYAALNTGHCHPKILKTLQEQAGTLHHTSRAVYNNILPDFCEMVTKYFDYDRVLPMNTGVEGGETAVKIARRWGYREKKIPENQAVVVFPQRNFWGRTLSAVSSSCTKEYYEHFGPFMPGLKVIPYNDVTALEEALKDPNVCAYMMEPIQGEAGVVVPNVGYLAEVRRLCTKYKVLWIADEIQTGLGRTGKLLATNHELVKPDITIIGKGLAGGVIPMSAVLSSNSIMSVMTPGSHGSTFGGNPLAAKVAITTLTIIKEDKLIENAADLGEKFRNELQARLPSDVVVEVRGKGLMNAIVLDKKYATAKQFCLQLVKNGLLTKPCDDVTLRFTPALTMTEEELYKGIEIIVNTANEFKK